MARCRHFLDRYYRSQRARRSPSHRHCLFDSDGQAHGQQELFGEEFGSRRNSWLNIDHLLR